MIAGALFRYGVGNDLPSRAQNGVTKFPALSRARAWAADFKRKILLAKLQTGEVQSLHLDRPHPAFAAGGFMCGHDPARRSAATRQG